MVLVHDLVIDVDGSPKNSQKDQLTYGSQWYWTLKGKITNDQMLFLLQAFGRMVYKVSKNQQKMAKETGQNVVAPPKYGCPYGYVIYIMHERV